MDSSSFMTRLNVEVNEFVPSSSPTLSYNDLTQPVHYPTDRHRRTTPMSHQKHRTASSKGVSLNHLISFSLPPRETTTRTTTRPSKANAPFNKQRFVNANFRFVLDASKDYSQHMQDPDLLVEWEDIDQVVVGATSEALCPICLDRAAAPRVAKCGHVYCWPCIQHYIQLGEKPWRKCPICYDAVYERDLRSVQTMYVFETSKPSLSQPVLVEFTLMKRLQGSTIALPIMQFDQWSDRQAPPPVDLDCAATFSKLLLSNQKHIQYALQQDKTDLRDALDTINNQLDAYPQTLGVASERPFVEACLKSIDDGLIRPEASRHSNRPLQARNASPVESNKNKSQNDSFYFYQSSDGQFLFLHPLDIKILKHAYGDYQSLTKTISVPVFSIQQSTVDADLRKKCKYLSHLPLSCDVMFCDVDVSSVVPQATLKQYSRELRDRKAKLTRLQSIDKPDSKLAINDEEDEKTKTQSSLMAMVGSSTDATRRSSVFSVPKIEQITIAPRSLSPSDDYTPTSRVPSGFDIPTSSQHDEFTSEYGSSSPTSFAKMAAASSMSNKPWTRQTKQRHISGGYDDDWYIDDYHGWTLDIEEGVLAQAEQRKAGNVQTSAVGSSDLNVGGKTKTRKGGKKITLVSNGGSRGRN